MEDDELMRRAAGGDSSAFDTIVKRHQDKVQRFAIRMLGGNSAEGADIAVSALLKLWEKRSEFHAVGQLEAWLLRTTYRLTLDYLRMKSPGSIEEGEEPSSECAGRAVQQSALAEAIRDAVMELPEAQRAVVVLSIYENMSYDAIAEVLDIPPGTVASRKNHAIAGLKKRLAAWEDR